MEQNSPNRGLQKISTALAAAQAQSALATSVRFPGEDGGKSLAEMAQRDLDAALQLLADRAQYITGASGAAIALRRDGMADMLCRASTGTNAPELGALLSTEFGLSGESVRTRRALRCDDAERDARVNRDVCRQLGIASVVVMPVVNDDQVLGVFELFSGKANAFGERDLSAVQRLSEMVETAVRLAHATEALPKAQDGKFVKDIVLDRSTVDQNGPAKPAVDPVPVGPIESATAVAAKAEPTKTESKLAPVSEAKVAPAKKPLFWSAALSPEPETAKPAESDQSHVPAVLRGLQKCQACGFPVSAGRMLCVECEEKKWRGQLRPQARTVATPAVAAPAKSVRPGSAAAPSMAKAAPVVPIPSASASATAGVSSQVPAVSPGKEDSANVRTESAPVEVKPVGSSEPIVEPAQIVAAAPEFVLSAGIAPSQSWLGANKYILIVFLVIAAAAAAVFFLR